MQIGNNTMIYALALSRVSLADQYTFAHLFFTKDEWRVKKNGLPNCILQSYETTPSKFRILVSMCGLTKLKVGLYVKPSDYLAMKNGEMYIAKPSRHIPLVQVLEEGASGQIVWVKWV